MRVVWHARGMLLRRLGEDTMSTLPKNAALIVVDVQKGFDDPGRGQRSSPHAETNILKLLLAWRKTERPIFHIQHISLEADSLLRADAPGHEFKRIAQPEGDEPIIQKHVNSAFIGTDLEERLHKNGIHTVVIVGLTTDHCVSTTTRMAGNLGFDTYAVSDATATFERTGFNGKHYTAEEMHNISLTSLHQEFATVVDTDTVRKMLE
jgi:nicotinamidase-related amidase